MDAIKKFEARVASISTLTYVRTCITVSRAFILSNSESHTVSNMPIYLNLFSRV